MKKKKVQKEKVQDGLTAIQLKRLMEVAKYGMDDADIVQLFGMTEKQLLHNYFKELYTSRIEGRAQIMKTGFALALSGEAPQFTKFWLQAQAKWVEKHIVEINSFNAAQLQEQEEFDFMQLTKDELKIYERLRAKAKKVRNSSN